MCVWYDDFSLVAQYKMWLCMNWTWVTDVSCKDVVMTAVQCVQCQTVVLGVRPIAWPPWFASKAGLLSGHVQQEFQIRICGSTREYYLLPY